MSDIKLLGVDPLGQAVSKQLTSKRTAAVVKMEVMLKVFAA